jgi:hypothetical protein
VSTRKVDDLVLALGVGPRISKNEVSGICADLDDQVAAFRGRSLSATSYPYLLTAELPAEEAAREKESALFQQFSDDWWPPPVPQPTMQSSATPNALLVGHAQERAVVVSPTGGQIPGRAPGFEISAPLAMTPPTMATVPGC